LLGGNLSSSTYGALPFIGYELRIFNSSSVVILSRKINILVGNVVVVIILAIVALRVRMARRTNDWSLSRWAGWDHHRDRHRLCRRRSFVSVRRSFDGSRNWCAAWELKFVRIVVHDLFDVVIVLTCIDAIAPSLAPRHTATSFLGHRSSGSDSRHRLTILHTGITSRSKYIFIEQKSVVEDY
jgi:hypothetical protein